MPTYRVAYKLWGSIEVEAHSEEEAKKMIEEPECVSDADLINGIEGLHGAGIEGDAIEIIEIERVDEECLAG
jgi:hypothetical protein